MEQNGGELVNWVTSALVNLCVKERPTVHSRLFTLRSPFSPRLLLIKASPPKISRRDVYLQVPPISRPRSSPSRLSYRPRVTDCNGIFRGLHACTASLLSTASEAREPSSEVEEDMCIGPGQCSPLFCAIRVWKVRATVFRGVFEGPGGGLTRDFAFLPSARRCLPSSCLPLPFPSFSFNLPYYFSIKLTTDLYFYQL